MKTIISLALAALAGFAGGVVAPLVTGPPYYDELRVTKLRASRIESDLIDVYWAIALPKPGSRKLGEQPEERSSSYGCRLSGSGITCESHVGRVHLSATPPIIYLQGEGGSEHQIVLTTMRTSTSFKVNPAPTDVALLVLNLTPYYEPKTLRGVNLLTEASLTGLIGLRKVEPSASERNAR